MEIRQLEYVVGIVEHGGFGRAAAALHVTQPALSEGVARLERELGVRLFDRVGRRALPTAAGDAFLDPARRVLRDLGVLRASVAAVTELQAGTLELVSLPTLAVDPLAPLVGAFRAAHPGITVRIDQPEDAADVARRVANGASEVGLAELPVDGAGLAQRALVDQELVVVLPPTSPLATRSWIGAKHLVDVPLVATPRGTSTRRLVDDAFTAVGAAPLVSVETEQREAIVPLVLADAGATVLPRAQADTAVVHGAVVVPPRPRVRRSIGLLWRDGPLSPAARAFLDVAADEGGVSRSGR
jgi:DNA-binding transcriptional LysR family regulator